MPLVKLNVFGCLPVSIGRRGAHQLVICSPHECGKRVVAAHVFQKKEASIWRRNNFNSRFGVEVSSVSRVWANVRFVDVHIISMDRTAEGIPGG